MNRFKLYVQSKHYLVRIQKKKVRSVSIFKSSII